MYDPCKFNKPCIYSVFVICLWCSGFASRAQSFDLTINRDHITIDGQQLEAFSTGFDHSAREVEKGWWRYCRTFGRPVNMRSYYRVIVPREVNQGNVDLELFARTASQRTGGSIFFLALNAANIPTARQNIYQPQIRVMLGDFKKKFYLELLQEQLEKEERKAKKLSKRVDRGQNKALQELTEQEKLLEGIRLKIKAVYRAEM